MRSLLLLACASVVVSTGCAVPRFSSERTSKQDIETFPLTSLELDTFNGNVEIVAHDEPLVTMEVAYKAYGSTEAEAKVNCDALDTTIEVNDGALSLSANKPADQWMASAAYTLRVPRECAVKIKTSNGKVEVRDLLANVNAGSSNGAITMLNIVGDVSVKTSNGTIRLTNCDGAFNAGTSNGKVFYTGRPVGTENEIRTSNGRVELDLAEDQATEIATKTSNGSITCSLAEQRVIEEGKREFHAVVGAGDLNSPTAFINVRTSNGSIKIRPLGAKVRAKAEDTPTEGEISNSEITL